MKKHFHIFLYIALFFLISNCSDQGMKPLDDQVLHISGQVNAGNQLSDSIEICFSSKVDTKLVTIQNTGQFNIKVYKDIEYKISFYSKKFTDTTFFVVFNQDSNFNINLLPIDYYPYDTDFQWTYTYHKKWMGAFDPYGCEEEFIVIRKIISYDEYNILNLIQLNGTGFSYFNSDTTHYIIDTTYTFNEIIFDGTKINTFLSEQSLSLPGNGMSKYLHSGEFAIRTNPYLYGDWRYDIYNKESSNFDSDTSKYFDKKCLSYKDDANDGITAILINNIGFILLESHDITGMTGHHIVLQLLNFNQK